ncbi:MAG: tRNA guanosine(15) transglycosylase TgtA [Desulfurococcales archaeon]|nr:tRNA guanosine(15) transglycosylase TgtA [Desulfurococcales archaeon]
MIGRVGLLFEVRDIDLAGRIGRLVTKSGTIETPAFFPVIDPRRQEISVEEIVGIGFGQLITNAYILLKTYGAEILEKGIHRFLGFDGIVMTDSGAYQLLEYGRIDVDQETIIKYQEGIGSDIGVILDVPTGDVGKKEAMKTVEETIKRAREALHLIESSETLWVLPIQGGKHLDLVEQSARIAASMPHYRVYGIGSPTVFLERYEYDTVIDIIHAAKSNLNPALPTHLFGAGHPLIIPFAVALGVDMFDSASYILYARDGRYMTRFGATPLESLDYFACNCPVCSSRTPGDLREMEKNERTRLLAIHNLYVIKNTIEEVKQHIREGRLWELLEAYARSHPRSLDALYRLKNYYGYIEKFLPRTKPDVRGVRFYGEESLWNPKLVRYKRYVLEGYRAPQAAKAVFYPLERGEPCVLNKKTTYKKEEHLAFYAPYLGVIPSDLCGIYPTIHSSWPKNLAEPVVSDLSKTLTQYMEKLAVQGYKSFDIFLFKGEPYSRLLEEKLREGARKIIEKHGATVNIGFLDA